VTVKEWITEQNAPRGRQTDRAESLTRLIESIRHLLNEFGTPRAITLDLWYADKYRAIHFDDAILQEILNAAKRAEPRNAAQQKLI
jgi:hypothetical protein